MPEIDKAVLLLRNRHIMRARACAYVCIMKSSTRTRVFPRTSTDSIMESIEFSEDMSVDAFTGE